MKSTFGTAARKQDVQTNAVLETGTLASGVAYEIRRMGIEHLDILCRFHEEIHASLGEDEKTFISRKTREDFKKYLSGRGVILGVFSGTEMMAMGNLLLPQKGDAPDTAGMADMNINMPVHKFGVLQSDSVLPKWRGNGLQLKLAAARIKVARALGRSHIMALADTRNIATIKSLLKAGLAIVSFGTDPDDGGEVFHMKGRIAPPPVIALNFRR